MTLGPICAKKTEEEILKEVFGDNDDDDDDDDDDLDEDKEEKDLQIVYESFQCPTKLCHTWICFPYLECLMMHL